MNDSYPFRCGILLLIFACLGCSHDEEDPRGNRVSVRGMVYLDNQPLERARIVFQSADGPSKITATGSIVDGLYEIPAELGPLVGRMRIEIQPDKIELEELESKRAGNLRKRVPWETVPIPAIYNTRSTLVREIKEDESQNNFEFRLLSKP